MNPLRARRSAIALAAVIAVSSCTTDSTTTPTTPPPPATRSTTVSDSAVDEDAVSVRPGFRALVEADAGRFVSSPGQIVTVRSPRRGIDVTMATGATEIGGAAPLGPDATFRIASVTKTFTAAAVFRLVEDGRVDLDADVATAGIPSTLLELLRQDGYAVEAITVRHLLTHTSGVADYAGNGAPDGPYTAAVLADPTRAWTPADQVRFAVDNFAPQSAPGAELNYSDTGYVLLGQLLESVTGHPLGAALRELLRFDELGMSATSMESLEPVPAAAGARAEQYLGTMPTSGLSPTIDLFGGGGLVSSTADLATFFEALGRGWVFDEPDTFDLMTSTTAPETAGASAAGIFRVDVAGTPCWQHDGFWGVRAVTCPDLDVTLTRTWNQAVPAEGWNADDLLLAFAGELGIDLTAEPGATAATSEAMLTHRLAIRDEPCPPGLRHDATCGLAIVPLDWSDPAGPTIEVWFGRTPAAAGPATGTVVPLLGGPGGAISGALDAFAPVADALADRDLLFVDGRGVGRSSRLACPSIETPEVAFGDALVDANRRCAEHLGERRDHFTTVASVLDIEAIRRALDLPPPSLLAFSYGTFLATVYAVLFPTVVQSAVLDGVDPLAKNPWDVAVPRGVGRVARLLCERSGTCVGDDVVDQIATVASQLRRRPHPLAGVEQALTEGVFVSITQAFIQAGSSEFLAAVAAGAAGDLTLLEPLAELVVTTQPGADGPASDSYSLGTVIWCNDYTYAWDRGLDPDARRVELGASLDRLPDDVFAPFSKQGWLDANWDHPDECLDWPAPTTPSALRVPRRGPFPDLPVLVINGDVDLQTPIENARVAAAQFPDHVMLEVVNGPHAIIPVSPCLLAVAIDVLRTAQLPATDACRDEALPVPATE